MSTTPAWVTVFVAVLSAILGSSLRAVWEEYRDFKSARRVVVRELRTNIRVLAHTTLPRTLPELLSDVGYRQVQLILARRLPQKLWEDLESIYGHFSPAAKEDPKKLLEGAHRLLPQMERAATDLDDYTPWPRIAWPRR